MHMTIEIKERPDRTVEVHIHSPAAMVTTREDRYATEIAKSLKAHLRQAMPGIVKRVLAQERN